MTKMQTIDIGKLEAEYREIESEAHRFCLTLKEQCEQLVLDNSIALGVPIEHRVKSWRSISEKIERKSIQLGCIRDLPDLIGLRLILLFLRDVGKVCELLRKSFKVVEQENTQKRLGATQFGYQSVHYLIQLPDSWLAVPSMSHFEGLTAEIQVRTVAQHIWAAASHVLQYKQEAAVPQPVKRSIHRVSALLETVDLEFERALENRDEYRGHEEPASPGTMLNVDLLERMLDSRLPAANKEPPEPYAELLEDLAHFGIYTVKDLHDLLDTQLDQALGLDAEGVAKAGVNGSGFSEITPERKAKHVYFTHTGIMRVILGQKDEKRWREYVKHRFPKSPATEDSDAAQPSSPPDSE